ncbi:MAG: efflux RND transporter periplasmic adaptor subunit [Acidobacteria bacterium]|nr:efflux RND transporter periplasmic adaptor subunit [Acidobacteriota bacterium]
MAVVLFASFASRDDSVPVLAAAVSRSTIQSVIATNGKIEPVNNFEAHAPVGTTVKRVLVKEGDRVRRGQLLVELDAAHARSQAAQALSQVRASEADMHALERGGTQEEVLSLQAELSKARDAYDAAERHLEALKRLEHSGAASPGEVRAAQDQLNAAAADRKLLESKEKERYSRPEIARIEAQHSEAESVYSAASDVLRQLFVRAPFDGTVYTVPVKQGAYVSAGDLLVEEADLRKVLVRAFVDEPDVARLSRGEKTEVTWDAMPGRIWQGAVTAIPAEVKLHGTRNVGETTCIVDNEDLKLLPNINVGVSIVTAEHAHALTIPREAVRQDESLPYVYAIVNNELHRQNVQTSISNLTKVEVTGGIPEGALVALGSVNSKPLHDRLSVRVVH